MKQFKKISNEVYYTDKTITKIEDHDIKFLKANVKDTQRKRIRICTHLNEGDSLQEMFIVLSKETYIRPHKHINKSESLHVIEGSADVIFFDDEGNIIEIISLSDSSSKWCFYYRINKPVYHTLIVKTDVFIFHETTQGPFRRSDTINAPWSPKEVNFIETEEFICQLKQSAKSFLTKG